MENKRVVFWLKLALIIGVITDALAVIPMISTDAAKLLWGFDTFPDMYRFAMGIAAVFMITWTILLYWAYRKPVERMMVAALTILILVSFIVVESLGVSNNVLELGKALPTMIMQGLWAILFSYACLNARRNYDKEMD